MFHGHGMAWYRMAAGRHDEDVGDRYHSRRSYEIAALWSPAKSLPRVSEKFVPLLRWLFRTRRTDKNELLDIFHCLAFAMHEKMSADVSRQLLSATCKSSCNRIWSRVCCWLLQEDR